VNARPGRTVPTDGSWLDDGAAAYAVVGKNGLTWKGIKPHMNFNQEAFDAECATLAHVAACASLEIVTVAGSGFFINSAHKGVADNKKADL